MPRVRAFALLTALALSGASCGKKAPPEAPVNAPELPAPAEAPHDPGAQPTAEKTAPKPKEQGPPVTTSEKTVTIDLTPYGIIAVMDLPEGCSFEHGNRLNIKAGENFELNLSYTSDSFTTEDSKAQFAKGGGWKFSVDVPGSYYAQNESLPSQFRMRHDLQIGDHRVAVYSSEFAQLDRAKADRMWVCVRSIRQTDGQKKAIVARKAAVARIAQLGGSVGEPALGGVQAQLSNGATDEAAALLKDVPDVASVSVTTPSYAKPPKLTAAGLKALSELPGVRSVSLSGEWLTDAKLAGFGPMPGLQSLTIRETSVSDSGLSALARVPNLRHLTLTRGRFPFSDAGMMHLAGLTQLVSLFVTDAHLTDAGLAPVAGMRNLRQIGVEGTRVTDAGLKHLANKPDLAYVALKRTAVRGAGLAHLAGAKEVTDLLLGGSDVTDEGLAGVRGLNVRAIDLSRTAVGDAGAAHLATVKGLSQLTLASTRITDAGVKHLGALRELEQLDLSWTAVTGATFTELAGCKRVDKLFLTGTELTDAALPALVALPVLNQLRLEQSPVSDAGLKVLSGIPADRPFHVLNDYWQFSRAAIDALVVARPMVTFLHTPPADPGAKDVKPPVPPAVAAKPDPAALFKKFDIKPEVDGDAPGMPVTAVSIGADALTDADLAHLRELKSLRSLYFAGQVTDAGLAHLAKLPALESLSIGSAQVTDAGLGHLAGLTSLRKLTLWGGKLSGDGLVHLKGLKNLQELHLPIGTLGAYLPRHLALLEGLSKLEVLRLGNNVSESSPHAIQLYAAFPNLKELDIWDPSHRALAHVGSMSVAKLTLLGPACNARVLGHVAKIKGLKEFYSSGGADEGGLRALARLASLEELRLSECQGVTDEGAGALASLKALKVLNLEQSRITSAGLEKLADLNQLKWLNLRNSRLDDGAGPLLAKLPHLELLDLEGTALTDTGLAALGSLKNLQSVQVNQTRVTVAGVKKLRAAREDLSVGFSAADAEPKGDR